MIKAGIIGATGYAGGELVRLLMGHKNAEIKWYGSKSYIDQRYADVYRNMFQVVEDVCKDDNIRELSRQVDVIFTATPQGFLASVLDEDILSAAKVIDLSADYRIKDVATYEKWYGIQHQSPQLIGEAVYGLCERNREAIKKARLVANPGCYPTCSILSVFPLLAEGLIDPATLIIDAKSGTSGAGRGAKVANLYCEVNENIKAYGVAGHRHTPEIEEQLSYAAGCPVVLNFTPHLVPMNRGILVTAYASLKETDGELPTPEQVRSAYRKYYDGERFVRLLPEGVCPETKWVEGSNYVDVNFKIDPRTKRVIMMGAMDNLVKGAAGQAVQNMNLMFGERESEGLELVPMFP
ncbi:MAG: N-acetyl-gamma-glutamyl-phosphate reductase [Eubacteriales bacterium]|nr:N-acetyl-gamma-glutamyl-phosphate reductase [Eubacteriales bacterium]